MCERRDNFRRDEVGVLCLVCVRWLISLMF